MIRIGTYEDIELINPFDPFGGNRKEEVADKRMYVFLNESGRPVAYISMAGYTLHDYPYVTFLLVHPEYRRHGIATALLHHVETLYAGKRIFISTEADNAEMMALLAQQRHLPSGALAGLNRDGVDELFFYKDV